MTDTERFWKHVDKNGPVPIHRPEIGPCWLWTGCYTRGYGFNPLFPEKRAHRMSWLIHKGEIPQGKHVLHQCDNPPCVNPNHLFIGTPQDNATDRGNKGRQVSLHGYDHPLTRITDEQVIEIRRLSASGMSSPKIAKIIPFSTTQIKRIIRRESRKYLPPQ